VDPNLTVPARPTHVLKDSERHFLVATGCRREELVSGRLSPLDDDVNVMKPARDFVRGRPKVGLRGQPQMRSPVPSGVRNENDLS
jgi:hypothetical protein